VVAFRRYLGAFLTGIRPANWVGSRTWPLLAVVATGLGLTSVPFWIPVVYAVSGALVVCLVVSILDTARHREYP
jgi:hypothetical protein